MKKLHHLILLISCGVLTSACQSVLPHKVAATPESIPLDARKAAVLLKMGKPQSKSEWVKEGQALGTVWEYRDYWWVKDGWANRFGSWDLFFDSKERYRGWRLVSPSSQMPEARERFSQVGSAM
jgi:hypothetical protein